MVIFLKKVVIVFDPKTPTKCESFEVDEGVIQLALHLSRLGNTCLPCGDVKKEALEILINNIRPEILEIATYMEYKLRSHDKEKKDSWKELSFDESICRALKELDEFKIAVKNNMPQEMAYQEAADAANFILFAARNYKEGRK